MKTKRCHMFCLPTGNYGNQIDGVSKPSSAKRKKKDGETEEEESELIQNSSDDDAEEEGDLVSVSSTPLMKPVITDRSGIQQYSRVLLEWMSNIGTTFNTITAVKVKTRLLAMIISTNGAVT